MSLAGFAAALTSSRGPRRDLETRRRVTGKSLKTARAARSSLMDGQTLAWIVFNVVIVGVLILDLVIFQRKPHVMGVREAMAWVAVFLALAFAVFVYFWRERAVALEFITGYLIEESLSVDNMFVFLMVFSYFAVPRAYQHRVLFWGILGALVMRAIMIFAGVALIQRFHWIIYVFGAFLIVESAEAAAADRHSALRSWRELTTCWNQRGCSNLTIGRFLWTSQFYRCAAWRLL